jgi:hypothetical protein
MLDSILNTHKEGDRAEAFAKELYKLTEATLMAHTIRAFERHMGSHFGFNRYVVRVYVNASVAKRMQHHQRVSYIVFDEAGANIYVDASLNNDRKRVCVAHELYHVHLAAIHGFYRDGKLARMRSTLPKGKELGAKSVEDYCDVFAARLCTQHDKFYRDPKNLDKLRFQEIPRSSYKNGDA